MARSSNYARSALGSVVGGSASDLAMLGGISSTVGQGLDQLASNAAEGDLKLRSLVGVVGPMAGLGLAMYGVSEAMKSAAENAKIAKEETKLWLDLQAQFDAANLEPPDLGPTAESFVTQYQGTIDALEELGYSIADFVAITRGDGVAALAEMNARQDELADKVANSTNGLMALTEAERAEYDILTNLTPNLAGYNEAQANAVTEYDKRKRQSEEMRAALEGELEAQDRANGVTSRAASVARTHATELGVLRNQVELYSNSVDGIDEEKLTEINAALDAGDVARAEKLLNEVTRSRVVKVGIELARGNVDAMAAANSGLGVALGADINKAFAALGMSSSIKAGVPGGRGGVGGGGGGGGGGGSSPAAAEATSWEEAIARAYDYGEITRDEYRKYLADRLAGEEKYGDAYDRTWRQIQSLDKEAADERAAAERDRLALEKKAADEAEKAAKDAADAAKEATREIERSQQALGNLIVNITNTNADPQSVVRAIEQARRMFGNRWLTG
jgi:hypothetical protein